MFDGKYLDWNQKRIKGILDFYGHKFMYSKKILDLGCGHADISGVFYRLGADITALDARQEHLKIASKKYPGIKTVKADLDRGWPFHGKSFDLVLNLDLLCHLSDYESHLRSVCHSTNYLILETAVCDSNDPYKVSIINENKSIYDLSVNGISSRPSATAIERVLTECGMSFKRQDQARYNCNSYTYDWQEKNNQDCNINKRRIWFATKNNIPVRFSSPLKFEPPPFISNSGIPILQNTQIPVMLPPPLPIMGQINNCDIGPKINTALCISGHLRTFEENFASVKENILSRLDCDVFIHTWDTVGLHYRPTDFPLKNLQIEKALEKITQLYNPKKIIVEPTKVFTTTQIMHKRLIDHRDIPGILSMFYKIELCNELKKQFEIESNFIYDCVIRFRSDLNIESCLPIDKNTNLDYLYFPMYGNFGGLCDQISYSNSKNMDLYSSLYSHINTYMEEGAPMHPEKLLKYHIDSQKLLHTKVHMKYTIRRSNGLIQNNQLLERALGFIK